MTRSLVSHTEVEWTLLINSPLSVRSEVRSKKNIVAIYMGSDQQEFLGWGSEVVGVSSLSNCDAWWIAAQQCMVDGLLISNLYNMHASPPPFSAVPGRILLSLAVLAIHLGILILAFSPNHVFSSWILSWHPCHLQHLEHPRWFFSCPSPDIQAAQAKHLSNGNEKHNKKLLTSKLSCQKKKRSCWPATVPRGMKLLLSNCSQKKHEVAAQQPLL